MAAHAPQFTGVFAAAVTPHRREGYEVDFAAMLELVDFIGRNGVQGICLLGATGEFINVKLAERIRLVHLAVKRSRVPIIAGVSHSTLDGALELADEAMSSGAVGLLLMPVYFFHYSQDEVIEFCMQFADSVPKATPILLYNIPQFTTGFSIETACALLATGRFAGIKDSSGDFDYFQKLRAFRDECDFTLMVGHDRLFTRARAEGADGVISGVACAVPELLVALNRAICEKSPDRVLALEGKLQEFLSWIDRFPTPVAIKVATSARGIKVGPLAVPLARDNVARLEEFKKWFPQWLPSMLK